jgi:hypothetical protein
MAHLGDRLAEFFYGELMPPEMADARRHVAECGECRLQVEQFERTHLALKSLPDEDLPRHIVFAEPERRSWFSVFASRFGAPLTAAAALVIAVLALVRPVPVPAPMYVSVPAPVPVSVQSQEIDYDRIARNLREPERAWIASELDKRDKEIQRLRGELVYYEFMQRTVLKETWENASSIQLLAQRTESRD